MQMADVLYGVTMQESGISKRVAIRFGDWPEEKKNGEVATENGQGKQLAAGQTQV